MRESSKTDQAKARASFMKIDKKRKRERERERERERDSAPQAADRACVIPFPRRSEKNGHGKHNETSRDENETRPRSIPKRAEPSN